MARQRQSGVQQLTGNDTLECAHPAPDGGRLRAPARGLVIIAPLLGHATWYAYRDMIR